MTRLLQITLCGMLAGLWLLPGTAIAAGQAPPTNAPESSATGPVVRRGKFTLTQADRDWWSFQPIRRARPPAVRRSPPPANPIDAFLLARLEARGLTMNRPASRRELLRRAYLDLIGLPPSPEAVEEFVADPSAGAWEKTIDRLLASPRYGERWGRHWLDLVRYAESNGYERDGPKPHAWRYRDYVIHSFNQDKPYDRFILEQLAGDELPGEFTAEAIVATGFYRLHVWDDEPDSTLAAEFDDLDDIMVATSATFLGLTVGCARCHDHKFDPISQADYYQLLAFVRSISPYGLQHTGGGGRGTGQITRALAPPKEVAAWETTHAARLPPLRQQLAGVTNAERKAAIEAEIRRVEGETPPYGSALAVNEEPAKPTRIFYRGDVHNPGDEVQPAFPSLLNAAAFQDGSATSTTPAPTNAASLPTAHRRLALAQWITQPGHPLTARVMMNRLWQHHFGRGLVRTPNDFGRTGELPTHPELLDYLAAEFIDNGWPLKRMHKLILLSQAYQMSSRADQPAALALDEANDLFWRQNPRRAEAETIRDSLLAISGALNLRMGGPSVYPTLPKEVHSTQDSAGKGWGESPADEQARRSIYLFVKRALLSPLLETFDYTTTTLPVGARSVTTVAPQALMLLNDEFVQEQGARFAQRIRHESGADEAAAIQRAFLLALQRRAEEDELGAARALLATQRRLARERGDPDPAGRAWRTFCVAILNLNEVVYVD